VIVFERFEPKGIGSPADVESVNLASRRAGDQRLANETPNLLPFPADFNWREVQPRCAARDYGPPYTLGGGRAGRV